jgi:hypothetical protein
MSASDEYTLADAPTDNLFGMGSADMKSEVTELLRLKRTRCR